MERERPVVREGLGGGFPGVREEKDERLRRSQRVIRSADFEKIFSGGQRYGGRYLTLWVWRGPEAALRAGVVASRKVGGAVQRNRAKRMMREIWRRNRSRFVLRVDVVLSARSEALVAGYRAVAEDFLRLAARAGLCSFTGNR